MKQTWTIINNFCKMNNKEVNITLKINETITTDTQVIVNKFNIVFPKIGDQVISVLKKITMLMSMLMLMLMLMSMLMSMLMLMLMSMLMSMLMLFIVTNNILLTQRMQDSNSKRCQSIPLCN